MIWIFEELGGMKEAKSYLNKNVVKPLLSGNYKRCPKGILLCGPSGTGKTILVNALSNESGINFINLRLGGNIVSKYVGESERNLMKAFEGIKAFEPCIVFIDELDQSIGRFEGNDSNSADKRLWGGDHGKENVR